MADRPSGEMLMLRLLAESTNNKYQFDTNPSECKVGIELC